MDASRSDPLAIGERQRHMIERYFGALDEQALASILNEVERRVISGGDWLFREGEEGSSLFLVERGRFQVWSDPEARSGGAPVRLLGELGPGEMIGEVGLLTGGSRSASVRAIRDSVLLEMDRAAFERLANAHPLLALEIAGQVAMRLRDRTASRDEHTRGPGNFALVPIGGTSGESFGRKAQLFAGDLCDTLDAHGSTRRLDVESLGRSGAASTGDWLDDLEARHDHLLLEAETRRTPWSEACLRHADVVLFVADASALPSAGEFAKIAGAGQLHAKRLLVLLHDGDAISNGARWGAALRPDEIHHVRASSRQRDLDRLARVLAGKGVGLVLGGGAARGFAHVGVYRALCESGIPVDWVGGASIGSVFAAAIAHDWTSDELESLAREAFVKQNPLADYTLPLVSLLRGRRVQRLVREYFDVDIEDLPLPFFCVSSHLDRGRVEVHESGDLWRAVRASVALPGVLPPAVVDGHLAIDGGVLNNLPVDVMRERRVGQVVAVDLSLREDRSVQFEEFPSAYEVLRRRILPFGRSPGVPNIFTLMVKASFVSSAAHTQSVRGLADLLLEPPVSHFGLLDVKAFDQLVEVGYTHAKERLASWKPLSRA